MLSAWDESYILSQEWFADVCLMISNIFSNWWLLHFYDWVASWKPRQETMQLSSKISKEPCSKTERWVIKRLCVWVKHHVNCLFVSFIQARKSWKKIETTIIESIFTEKSFKLNAKIKIGKFQQINLIKVIEAIIEVLKDGIYHFSSAGFTISTILVNSLDEKRLNPSKYVI